MSLRAKVLPTCRLSWSFRRRASELIVARAAWRGLSNLRMRKKVSIIILISAILSIFVSIISILSTAHHHLPDQSHSLVYGLSI
jgi:hypothetical protein